MKQLLSVLYEWTKKLIYEQKVPLSIFFYQVCTCFLTVRTEQNEITWGEEPVILVILLVCLKPEHSIKNLTNLKKAFEWTQLMSDKL